MTTTTFEAPEIHQLVVNTLDKLGCRPFGSDGTTWEHPTGIRVTVGYAGGQIRVRRYAPGNDRFHRIPPTVWDVRGLPSEAEVVEFIGVRAVPALDPSPEELNRLARYELAEDAPESLRQRLSFALGDVMDELGMSPGRFYAPVLADAALAVIRGEK